MVNGFISQEGINNLKTLSYEFKVDNKSIGEKYIFNGIILF
jgi:hypothetical protein